MPCQGLPTDETSECVDAHKHMSVIVVLNSIELVVDLMRFPGQLIPRTPKAIFMTHHISAAGESDTAENDSCDSPLEPNSPLYGLSERADSERSTSKFISYFILHLLLESQKLWKLIMCLIQ